VETGVVARAPWRTSGSTAQITLLRVLGFVILDWIGSA
jgi:hypothetical protein